MPEKGAVYKCTTCELMVLVLNEDDGELVCDGQPMVLQVPNAAKMAPEVHIPVIEKTPNGYKVKVGKKPHPMEQDHYIMWIELEADTICYFHCLNPGDKPEAEFLITASKVEARAYCNIHGLWKS